MRTVHENIPGTEIASVRYEPRSPLATLLLLPGVGIRQEIFASFGTWMATRGVRVASIDWTGVGDSPLPEGEGRTTTLTSWATRDAVLALRSIRERFRGPVGLVGHSFGGQALAVADELQEVDQIVLVASQTPWWRFYDWRVGVVFHLSYRFLGPLMEVVPGWAGVGADLPGGVVAEWARWGRSRGTYFEYVPGAVERLAAIDVPVLAYSFPDDPMATPAAVRDLLDKIPAEVLEHRIVDAGEVGVSRIGHIDFLRRDTYAPWWEEIQRRILGSGRQRASA